MGSELNSLLSQIGKDKGIDRKVLIEAIESAMLSAARKHFGHNLILETQFNEETGIVEVIEFRTVVEKVEDHATQISLDEARKMYDADARVGDELGRKLETDVLGRIAAQTAKQVILQKVRDAERDIIYNEFKGRKGDLVNGIVQRYERGNLIVNLGRTDAVMPRREQILRERYRRGDRIRSMILDVDPSARGPQVILTRSHPDYLKKLFEIEVPEIAEKIVEIKAAAREPGERAKIAVYSNDTSVDPVGACVGIKGSRVQAVVQELRGERIDIIVWTLDEPSFVARALAPAEVARVVVDEDEHSMEVVVPDDQLSLAIGRRGQNVKLASKLTGWKIDVRSVSLAEEEAKRARTSLESIPGIGLGYAEIFYQAGYRSAREVAEAAVEDLTEIEGITSERASQILQSAREYVETLPEQEEDEETRSQNALSDLDKLMLSPEIKEKLKSGGYKTIQSLAVAELEEIQEAAGLSEDDVSSVREATDAFLKSKPADRALPGI